MDSIRKCFIVVLLLRVFGKSLGLTRSSFFLLTLNGGSGDCRYTQSQKVQSTYMVQSMVSEVVISLMVWVSIPHMGTSDPLGIGLGFGV